MSKKTAKVTQFAQVLAAQRKKPKVTQQTTLFPTSV
jgi:hypothetical protein